MYSFHYSKHKKRKPCDFLFCGERGILSLSLKRLRRFLR